MSIALRWSDGVVICNVVWWVALCVHCRAVCFMLRRTVYSNDLFAWPPNPIGCPHEMTEDTGKKETENKTNPETLKSHRKGKTWAEKKCSSWVHLTKPKSLSYYYIILQEQFDVLFISNVAPSNTRPGGLRESSKYRSKSEIGLAWHGPQSSLFLNNSSSNNPSCVLQFPTGG